MPDKPPDTLPADFFSKAPDTLPANFFTQPGQSLPPETPESKARREKENKEPIDYAGIRKAALPMAGGIAGGLLAPFTGGLSAVPAALVAAGSAGIGGALGSSVEQGIEKFRGEPDAPKTFGEGAKRAGIEGAEQGEAEIGGRMMGGILEKVVGRYINPERMYQSGLKPTGTNEGKVLGTIRSGIKENIPLTERAAGVVRERINKLDSQIEGSISSAPADIPPSSYVKNVTAKLDDLRKKWRNDATNGAQFVDRIDEMERQFLVQHGNVQPLVKTVQVPSKGGLVSPGGQPVMVSQQVTINPEDMTLAELRQNARPLKTGNAQEIKKQTYETIRTAKKAAWDPGQHPGLSVRGNQEIARAMKEELEKVYPEIKKLNAREGALIELENQLQRFAKREWNRQNIPYIPMVLGGAVGGALSHGSGGGMEAGALTASIMKHMLENPAVKSRIAIALDRAAKLPGAKAAAFAAKQVPQTAIRAGLASLEPPPQKPTQ